MLALVTVTVAAVLVSSVLGLSAATTRRQSQSVDDRRAFYLCEAGLAEAFEAVRVGRRGQLGSIDAPAMFGDGLGVGGRYAGAGRPDAPGEHRRLWRRAGDARDHR